MGKSGSGIVEGYCVSIGVMSCNSLVLKIKHKRDLSSEEIEAS